MNADTRTAPRVLLIGAGFIGGHVATGMRAKGWTVIATSRSAQPDAPAVDVCDVQSIERAIEVARPDVVIHMAALVHKRRGEVNADDYDRVNHQGFRNVLRACRGRVRRVILTSSASVYGDLPRREPLAEDAIVDPRTPYGRSKLAAERAGVDAALQPNDVVVLRLPSVYARDWLLLVRTRAYVPLLSQRMLLSVVGRQPLFSFCAIENAVQAFMLAADGTLAAGTYNVDDERPYTQREIREVVSALDGVRLTLPLPTEPTFTVAHFVSRLLPGQLGELMRAYVNKLLVGLVVDSSKIRAAGYRPTAVMRDMLKP